MRASAWRIYLAAGAAAVAGYFLVPDNWWQTGLNAGIGLAGVAGLLVGVRLHRPRRPGVWWLLAGGLSCISDRRPQPTHLGRRAAGGDGPRPA